MIQLSRLREDAAGRRVFLGAIIAISIAAVAALLAFEMPSRVTLPVALGLTGLVLWTSIRLPRRSLEEEVGIALRQWAARGGEAARAQELRQAYSDHFAGRRLLLRDPEEGIRRLELATRGFTDFLDHLRDVGEQAGVGGLEASARFHRAASRKLLAEREDDEVGSRDLNEKALADLIGFERRHTRWRLLVPGALALRLRCRLALGDLDAAEADQLVLDRILAGEPSPPEILDTREDLGSALWSESSRAFSGEDVDALRRRALAHFDAWINQLGPGHLGARLKVARLNDEIERSDRVIALLEGESAGQVARRDQLEANRLLARAHLRRREFEASLRFYSVLMSVPGPENPWHRDPEVIREIGRAERSLDIDDEDDGDEDDDDGR